MKETKTSNREQRTRAAIAALLAGVYVLTDLCLTLDGNKRKILGSSTKVVKGEKKGVLTVVLYLSPAIECGQNLCLWASAGCAGACLGHSSGQMVFNSSKLARVAKSLWFLHFRNHFLCQLREEIHAHVRRAKRLGMIPAIRLNGSSDIKWEQHLDMSGEFAAVRFYDYTKAPRSERPDPPPNYHVAFSLSERRDSLANALDYLRNGRTATIVVRTPEQAAQLVARGFMGFPAVDGDESDVRFDDPPGSWVALYAKGAAKHDRSGFVRDYDPSTDLDLAMEEGRGVWRT